MPSENQMDWVTRFMSAGVGGVSALLAIGASLPNSPREGMFRVGCGTFVTFCTTGFALDRCGIIPTVDAVLVAGLLIGAVSWYVFGAVIILFQRSSSTFARWIVKKITGMELDEHGNVMKPGGDVK